MNTVISNYTIVIVLNCKSFFIDSLRPTKLAGIIIVEGDNYKLTHIRTVTILIRDNNKRLHVIKIPNALYFLFSPVNIVSVGRLSL